MITEKRNERKRDTIVDQYGNVTDAAAKVNLLLTNHYSEVSKNDVVTCFLSSWIGESGL